MSTLKFWDINKYGNQNHFFLKFLKEEDSMGNLSSQRKGRPWITVLGKNTEEESPMYSVPYVFSPLCIQSPMYSVLYVFSPLDFGV